MKNQPAHDRVCASELPWDREALHVTLHRERIRRTVDAAWICAIEEALPHVSAALQAPRHTLRERVEIRPAERVQRVARHADRYLSRHAADARFHDDGTVTPARLPNAVREDSLQTYENRFLNTLVRRLYAFVDRRYRLLAEQSEYTSRTTLRVRIPLSDGTSMRWESAWDEEHDQPTSDPWLPRVAQLHRAVTACMHSDLVRQLGERAIVHPPLYPTNAMKQHVDWQHCLTLFRFLEQYRGLGCRVEIEEYTETPDESCLRELIPILREQSALMRRLSTQTARTAATATLRTEPLLHVTEQELRVSEFDAHDTEYRRRFSVSVPDTPYRRLSAEEQGICRAIETALEADAQQRQATPPRRAIRTERAVIRLDELSRHFADGARITPASLIEKKLVHSRTQRIKILDGGELHKKLHITADAFSSDAQRRIEQAGGTATVRNHSTREK